MPKAYLTLMKQVARTAGDIMRRHYGGAFQIYTKPDNSQVTDVDLEISEVVQRQTKEAFPEVGLYSEESEQKPPIRPDKSYFVIDELDGTSYFINREPGFSHQAAFYDGATGRLTIGLVYYPLDDIMLYAVRGEGAWREQNGFVTPLAAPPFPPPEELHYAHPARYRGDKYWNLFDRLGVDEGRVVMVDARRTLQFVTNALHVAIFLQRRIPEWDWSGEKVILEELGFNHSYLDGRPTRFQEPPPVNNPGYLICPAAYRDYFLEKDLL